MEPPHGRAAAALARPGRGSAPAGGLPGRAPWWLEGVRRKNNARHVASRDRCADLPATRAIRGGYPPLRPALGEGAPVKKRQKRQKRRGATTLVASVVSTFDLGRPTLPGHQSLGASPAPRVMGRRRTRRRHKKRRRSRIEENLADDLLRGRRAIALFYLGGDGPEELRKITSLLNQVPKDQRLPHYREGNVPVSRKTWLRQHTTRLAKHLPAA
jgi:hypothetical protein